MNARGFTLVEVMVALAIAASALVVMYSRLGFSADLLHEVEYQFLAIETGLEVLERERVRQEVSTMETHGELDVSGFHLRWKKHSERTKVAGFVRQNVTVSAEKEAPIELFLYRAVP